MLSRIAEGLFWIGRYIERADGTARILDVHLQLLLENPWIGEDAYSALLSVMGTTTDHEDIGREDLLRILGVDPGESSSIAYSLVAARENARRAREIVSTELWEVLNTTRARMPDTVSSQQAADFFAWVRERSALAVGIADSASSRDDAWQFFTLGRFLERADMIARLLATRSLTEASGPSWTTLLRSAGAYESYLKTYRGVPSTHNAAEFLILDRLFPRSILFAVLRAEQCIRDIGPAETGRIGFSDQSLRILGQIRSDLEYRPAAEILEHLTAHMERVQEAISDAAESIRQRYFPTNAQPIWVGESA